MSARAPITKTGSERLRAELERLKSTERPRIIAAIAEARAHGDHKENAEYHAAVGLYLRRVDHLRARQLRFDFGNAAFDKALFFFRIVSQIISIRQ